MANRTVFAGFYSAVDFNFGGGAGFPPALVITSAPTTSPLTNPQTFTVLNGNIELTDGTLAVALNANAPILVGAGPGQEKMTPTSVSTVTPATPNTTTFTGTFLQTHGLGDPVASGTFGLQEAINAAVTAGGGKVVVDQAWVKAGGTQAMINAAVFNSPKTVDIVDNRT